jgi:hypothetical protein
MTAFMRRIDDQCGLTTCHQKATQEVFIGSSGTGRFDKYVGVYCKSHAILVVNQLNKKKGS